MILIGIKKLLLEDFEKENYKYITCKELFVDGVEIKKCKEYIYIKNKIKIRKL